ncbi:unnamed protein product [Discosporangium mesarthrocarpum]
MFLRNVLDFLHPLRGVRNSRWCTKTSWGSINLAENPFRSARSRHIDTRHHFLRELVSDK